MATYGSSLDSLMANRLAEDALAAREQASYRDYLNAMANTNIRGREQQSMDRYRQGELGSRNLQTQAYRDVGLGQSGAYRDVGLNQGNAYRDVGLRGYDVQRELGLGQQGVQRELGLGQLALGNRDVDVRRELGQGQLALGGRNVDVQRELGLGQQGVQRELGLQDIGVRYDLGKRQSDLGGRQLDVNRELGLGQLQLNRDVATRMTPLQQALVDQYGGVGQAIQQVPGAFGAGQSQEMQLLRANKQMEEESAYQNALNASTQQALEEYGLQTESGFGWRWNSDRTGAIQDIIKNYGVTAPQAARIYTENRLAPTFGRTSRFQNLMAPQASSPSGQTNTASMVPSMQGYQQWLQGRSGK
jgi:hypothetical protein